jgi:hypothetical protein
MHAVPARAALLVAPTAARRALARVSQLRATLRTGASAAAATPAPMLIHQFPALGDNYGYLLHDEQTGATAAVDTPEVRRASAVRRFSQNPPPALSDAAAARCVCAGRCHRARAGGEGVEADAHPEHAPPQRPHRRQLGALKRHLLKHARVLLRVLGSLGRSSSSATARA